MHENVMNITSLIKNPPDEIYKDFYHIKFIDKLGLLNTWANYKYCHSTDAAAENAITKKVIIPIMFITAPF